MKHPNNIFVVSYHYTRDIRESRYPEIKGMEIFQFKEQLDFFRSNFHVISMNKLIEALDNPCIILPENSILLTFDDGYIDNYTVAFPLLKERGMQGSFFVHSDLLDGNKILDANKLQFVLASADESSIMNDLLEKIEASHNEYNIQSKEELVEQYAKPNRWDTAETMFIKRMLQIVLPFNLRHEIINTLFIKYIDISESIFAKELYVNMDQLHLMKADGMHIGIQGDADTLLGDMTEDDMRGMIDGSLRKMSEILDKNNWTISFHRDKGLSDVVSYIREKGCSLGFSTDTGLCKVGSEDRYAIKRLDCNDFPPKSENYLNF